jgi:Methyltransferase small domain
MDVSPEALALAAENRELTGVNGRVHLVEHDLTSGLGESQFDLVVSNPPYVISPDASFAYRDSGLPADDLCRGIVHDLPRSLADGGYAHVLVSWVHERERWAEPLRRWVAGGGCDALLLHFGSQDPVSHCAQWLAPLAESDPAEYERALGRWLGYLSAEGIEAIGYGAVVLRRRDGAANWIREEDVDLERLESAGEHTLRLFAAEDFLRGLADEHELLDRPFALAPGHRLEQTVAWEHGLPLVEAQTLRVDGGFGFRIGVDRYTAGLLPHFDGEAPLGQVLMRAAAQTELEPDERERFVPAALPVVRRLIGLGVLVPAER